MGSLGRELRAAGLNIELDILECNASGRPTGGFLLDSHADEEPIRQKADEQPPVVNPPVQQESHEEHAIPHGGTLEPKRPRRFWPLVGTLATIVVTLAGFILNVFGVRTLYQNTRQPKVDIAFYRIENGQTEIAQSGPEVSVTEEDIAQSRVRVPIALAVRNHDGRTVEVAEVQVRYDKRLTVTSEGHARIDPDNRLLVYDHNLGSVVSNDYYTPLKTLDTISIPFNFDRSGAVGLTKDAIPLYAEVLTGTPKGQGAPKDVSLGITVYFKDRPSVSVTMPVKLVGLLAELRFVLPHFHGFQNLTSEEQRLFQHPPPGLTLNQWTQTISNNGSHATVSYKKLQFRKVTYQLIYVDGQLRRMIVGNRRIKALHLSYGCLAATDRS